MKKVSGRIAAAGLLALAAAGCGASARTTEGGSAPPAAAAAGSAQRGHTGADVRFLHGMIAHHAQALAMTELVPSRTERRDMRLLAERIEVSQRDEIAAMRRWLERRGERAPAADPHHAHHGGGHAEMPGMVSPEQLGQLAAASGPGFDRLFLELMIHHHEGALTMVEGLLASPGSGQDAELYQMVSEIDADQRTEIARMRRMLDSPPPGAGSR
jgi:uncharacterized protein (DUF305 family)